MGLIFATVAVVVAAVIAGRIAERKNRNPRRWFLVSLLAGFGAVFVVPPLLDLGQIGLLEMVFLVIPAPVVVVLLPKMPARGEP